MTEQERSVRDWLDNTTAVELAVCDVATLRPTDTLADAAAVFMKEKISGAPVVDESGTCVGVLSLNDLLRASIEPEEDAALHYADYFRSHLPLEPGVVPDRLVRVSKNGMPVAEQLVARFMTTDVVTVGEEASLSEVLRALVSLHIHRVIVLGPRGHLLGVVSTVDVLSGVLRAAGMFTTGLSLFGGSAENGSGGKKKSRSSRKKKVRK